MFGRTLVMLRKLIRDQSANVAVITALSAIPLIGIMGLAVDYAIALSTKSKLDAAADSAVIAATTKAKSVINSGGTVAAAIQQGQDQGLASFRANMGALSFVNSLPVPTVTIVPQGQTLAATVTYTATSQNQFGMLFNKSSAALTGVSSSQTVLTPYYQFIFVVDISGSMAIGGTATDIAGLTADPRIGCAFACHDPYHNRGQDLRAYAKADGWTLKIDYVNQAIQTFIQDLGTQTASIPGVFSVGIDTYATNFNVLQTPTTSLSTAKSQAAAIDIEPMTTLAVSQGYTRTTSSLNQALSKVTNIGDGTAPNKQATYFIFLSDGVEDIEGNMIYGRGTDVTYTSACTAIKNAGATMISIVAPYPVVDDNQYPILVAPIANKLAPAMKACASSPTYAFQANDGPAINTAVQAALQQILQGMTRLTQ